MNQIPVWAKQKIQRVDLERVVRDIHEKWGYARDELEVWVTPSEIVLRLRGKDGEQLLFKTAWNYDPFARWIIWTTMFMLFPMSVGFERTGIFPDGLGLFAGPCFVSGIAMLCRKQIEASFDSNVLTQLEINASARAVTYHELLFEAAFAFWWLQNRPLFSGVKDYFVGWTYQDNNFDRGVTESIRKALVDLYRTDAETVMRGTPEERWVNRYYFVENSLAAYQEATKFRGAWFRSVALPLWVHGVVFATSSAFLIFGLLVVPYVIPFLDNLAK